MVTETTAQPTSWTDEDGNVFGLDPAACWRGAGLLLAAHPTDPTRFVAIADDGRRFSGRLPYDPFMPEGQMRREVMSRMQDDPPRLGEGFGEWAERVCKAATAEFDRRGDELERRLAGDGFVRGDTITPTQIRYLWRPYIPLGAPT